MKSRTIEFTQTAAFTGFNGKVSGTSIRPLTQLGAVQFTCRTPIEIKVEQKETTWKDEVKDWYNEYDILIWIGAGVVTVILICCCSCYCWMRCKRREIRRLKEQGEQKQKKLDLYRVKEKEGKDKKDKGKDLDESQKKLKQHDSLDAKAQMKDDIILSLQRELTKQKEK